MEDRRIRVKDRTKIAVAAGDPAGIGPEISLKAALDPAVRATGADANDVYLMLCFDDTRIVHCTLHRSVKDAVAMITREKVLHVIEATNRTLAQIGLAAPKIAVGGLNPHAGEGGLFGREEIEVIRPAIDAATAQGAAVSGPFGADTMLRRQGFEAFIVLLHDQGEIPDYLDAPDMY